MTFAFRGRPVEIRYSAELRDTAGNPAHAATYIRERLIVLDRALRRNTHEHARILAHELLHFTWTRLGNAARREWESLIADEFRRGARGEAGWSAEWRKRLLSEKDILHRSRKWREYCCESFCDTGAVWLTSRRDENTLADRTLRARIAWLSSTLTDRNVPI